MKTYKILKRWRARDLEEEVESFLSDGWDVVGGICVTFDPTEKNSDYNTIYYQAVVNETAKLIGRVANDK